LEGREIIQKTQQKSTKSFSTLYGFTWTAYAIAGAVGPVIMGRAFDATGSYRALLVQLAAVTLVVAALLLLLPRSKTTFAIREG
jgi:cyanate permease